MQPEIDGRRAVENLRALVRIPTVSRLDDGETDWEPFAAFRAELATRYPRAHASLDLELVDNHSMLFRWTGAGEGDPSILMAHYDVVAATNEGWEHPPFGGELVGEAGEDYVWGRGTLDDKSSLISILEGVETHLADGFTPDHDIYLSFGHNEETAGSGARVIVDLLEERGIRPALVLDEGGAVVEGIFPGVTEPIAVVGVSEKGILSLRLVVDQQGGHASTPPAFAATVRLARAIMRLNRKPFRKSFVPTNLEMIRTLGAHARQPLKWVFTNLWLSKLPLLGLFARLGDETNAMVRTTQVVTQLSGAQAANALPERAEAIVNIRIAIDSNVEESIAHVRRAIRDEAVQVEALHPTEPSPVSPTSGRAWELVKSTIEETFGGTIVTPYVMLGASDSRHFTRISEHVYRFSPFEMSKEERGTLHAKNERISVATFLCGVGFYTRLIGKL
ncbi:carboxypeptidase PM20D1 [Cryobacterium mesophilum]|uniref:M20/M25/M40 family metallo-hydrolase n=1 Tax=Terrimesophilobacter mesophilus TaxID=433647 RepID=UPI0017F0AD75|nr:M20/M25/M40 family metallo-hydrolase [Terrimesophilobacter mesophilus]MBB5634086.1 carboxypeptidase PM20D1 [Terrimesophilobacter mesophilus]